MSKTAGHSAWESLLLVSLVLGCTGGEGDESSTPSSPTREPSPSPQQAETSPPPQVTPVVEAGFAIATSGCPMAHCDSRLSDQVHLPAPVGEVGIRWHDQDVQGSNYGLGCSSNGDRVACSLGGSSPVGPFLQVYDALGTRLWNSDLLNFFAFSSAPLVDDEGGVIAIDTEVILRFDPEGELLWSQRAAGGIPVSPVPLQGGLLFVSGLGGPMAVYDSITGKLLEEQTLEEVWRDQPGRFDSRNSAVTMGKRAYVSTEFIPDAGVNEEEPRPARLYALDFDPAASPGSRLKVAWYFEFGARSGASPLRVGDVIYFDGDRLSADDPVDPHFFAVRDGGGAPELLWRSPIPGPAFASAPEDPRGGLWTFGQDAPELVRLDTSTGAVLQRVDVDNLIDAPGTHNPASAMSIAEGPGGHPVLMVVAFDDTRLDSWVVAIDLEDEQLVWKVPVGDEFIEWSAAQLPIALTPTGEPVVVLSTFAAGVLGLGVME